jgi:hypothetical protein
MSGSQISLSVRPSHPCICLSAHLRRGFARDERGHDDPVNLVPRQPTSSETMCSMLVDRRGHRLCSQQMEAIMRKHRDLENLPSFQHHA